MLLNKILSISLVASILLLSSCGETPVNSDTPSKTENEESTTTPTPENPNSENSGQSTDAPTSSSSTLADGEYGYVMDVDGKQVSNNKVLALDGFDRQVAGFLTLGDTPTLQLRMIPENVPAASYTCGEGAAFRKIAMTYNGYVSDNEAHPGNCSITLSATGKVYEGTFSGTLYTASGDKINITNGFFRNDGSTLN